MFSYDTFLIIRYEFIKKFSIYQASKIVLESSTNFVFDWHIVTNLVRAGHLTTDRTEQTSTVEQASTVEQTSTGEQTSTIEQTSTVERISTVEQGTEVHEQYI